MKFAKRCSVPKHQADHARRMRKAMTDAEKKLWFELRRRLPVEGTHFRRQVPIGSYIVDFCCLAERLVIEVDGNQHATDEAHAYDARRTASIAASGFRVLRFSNEDVLCTTDSVLDTIFAALSEGSHAHG